MSTTVKLKRGSGSDPSASDMVVGEPVIRTDTAELFFKKDDGSVAKVSGGGGGPDFKYLALRNAANDGSASYPGNDFTLVTSGTTTAVSPAAANTLLVSYGGVIQRPNSGTSTSGITGFIVDGSRFKTATNLAAAPDFILYQESGGIGEPSDNTVTTAKIVDDAVTADKLANSINSAIAANTAKVTNATHSGEVTGATALTIADNVVDEANLKVSNSPTNGYFLSAQSGNTGGLTWAGVDLSAYLPLAGGTMTGTLNISSSNKLRLGDSAEIQINHLGGNSFIEHTLSTGNLFIQADSLRLTNTNRDETFIACNDDGNVEIYYDNSKKFETYSNGVQISGRLDVSDYINITGGADLYLADNGKANFGNSTDLEIYHDASNSYIKNDTGNLKLSVAGGSNQVEINKGAVSEHLAKFIADGAVELYYDNSQRLATSSTGIWVSGAISGESVDLADSKKVLLGSGDDLEIFHDGSHSRISAYNTGNLLLKSQHDTKIEFGDSGGATEVGLHAIRNGAVELYCDGSKKFETTSVGAQVTGRLVLDGGYLHISGSDLYIDDSRKAYFGAGSDLQIYHDGSNNYIDNQNGTLKIRLTNGVDFIELQQDRDVWIKGNPKPWDNNTYDLGSSSYRWRNIYTNDLNLSNEGGSNDVDGTWGSYTIQEGAEDLFLVNKRSGKKYKFNLTEVS